MKLVIGLGNPGPEYAWSRHNAGWLALDACIKRAGQGEPRMKYSGAFWPASSVDGEKVAFLKPLTYMNLSGRSVAEAVRYHNIEPCDVLVIFDDVAIPFGTLRYRSSGSAGGQKGMISIIGPLGTADIPRLRIGVGSPAPRIEMADWVLGKFPKDQLELFPQLDDLVWDGFKKWLSGDAGDGFTMRIKSSEPSQVRSPKPDKKRAAEPASSTVGKDSSEVVLRQSTVVPSE